MISTSTCQAAAAADLAAVALLLLLVGAGDGTLLGGLSYPARRYDRCDESYLRSQCSGVGCALPGVVTEVTSHAGSIIAGMANNQ